VAQELVERQSDRQGDQDAEHESRISSAVVILPLSAVWLAAHGAYRALGFRSRLLRAGGHNAHLYDRQGLGAAPPALLVHGMGGNAAGFLPIVRAVLRASRRVVAIELPGHGRAQLEEGEAPATLQECAQAVGAALGELGEPAVLIGSSLGGALSLFTAVTLPDLVVAVVGLNPAGAPLIGAKREELLQAFRSGGLAMNRRLYHRPPRLGWLFARDLTRHWASPPVQQFVAEIGADVPGIDLAAIDKPVLILWGEHDRILPASSVEYFRKHLRKGAVEVIAGSGHLPMIERSAQVAARIALFLRELV
jgi:pyruvate dehydrogenase E2 component (dihydrolipoamide acetyltransferase)